MLTATYQSIIAGVQCQSSLKSQTTQHQPASQQSSSCKKHMTNWCVNHILLFKDSAAAGNEQQQVSNSLGVGRHTQDARSDVLA
jgi:hypothetical protein